MSKVMFAAVLLACSQAALASDISVEAACNRRHVYLGESLVLTFKVIGTTDELGPDVSGIRNGKVRLLDSRPESAVITTVVNGRWVRQQHVGRYYYFEISPQQPGTFTPGPVRVTYRGRTYTASGPPIQVTGTDAQDWVVLSVSASTNRMLIDQPFEVTLSIDLKRLPTPYDSVDPLDPRAPPDLDIPFLQPGQISGLAGPDINAFLQPRLIRDARKPGFGINKRMLRVDPFAMRSLFDFDPFAREQPARYRFDRAEVQHGDTAYFRYTLTVGFTPEYEGTYTLGPVLFKGRTVTGATANGQAVTQPVLAVGAAETVRVVPPPEEGRPESYIGVVATNVTLESMLDVQTCKLGDPLVLTLTVRGAFKPDTLYPPALGNQPDLAKSFRVYDDTVQPRAIDGGKEFQYTIRPTKTGTYEVPPIRLAYFNTRHNAYRMLETAAIPIRVNPAVQLTATNVIGGAGQDLTVRSLRRPGEFVPAPITMDPGGALPSGISLERWHAAALLGAPALYLVLLVTINAARRRTAGRKRRIQAAAPGHLRKALSRLIASDPGKIRSEQLVDIAREYLSERLGLPGASVTPSDAAAALKERGTPAPLAEAFAAVLERNFNLVYAGTSAPAASLADDCVALRDLVDQIEPHLRVEE